MEGKWVCEEQVGVCVEEQAGVGERQAEGQVGGVGQGRGWRAG